jgi:hypothetical protein
MIVSTFSFCLSFGLHKAKLCGVQPYKGKVDNNDENEMEDFDAILDEKSKIHVSQIDKSQIDNQ